MRHRAFLLIACAGLLLGCDHTSPYAIAVEPPTPPQPGVPTRLTYSIDGDQWPAWLPDASGIGYSYHPTDHAGHDRCLAFLPAEGGRITSRICTGDLNHPDSVRAVTTHAISAGGRLALVAESGALLLPAPAYRSLYVGRRGGALTRVLGFPYLASSGHLHNSAVNMVWTSETTLVYVGAWVGYTSARDFAVRDTTFGGIELVMLTMRIDEPATPTVIAGTDGASSLSPGPADTVYFTRIGDSRVFWLSTATGQQGTLYDFAALGVARDVQVVGPTMVAAVGGRVHPYFAEFAGNVPAQADSGGPIYAVRLPAGPPVLVADASTGKQIGSFTQRRLALDRTGQFIVAERLHVTDRDLGPERDTVITWDSDLWMFRVP